MKNKTLTSMLALLLLALSTTPIAADLAQLKAAGQVGEQMDGYLGIVTPNASADIKALVDNINALRQAEYQRIAAKNGVSIDEVAKLTAQKVINQTTHGQFVQTPSGWKKR